MLKDGATILTDCRDRTFIKRQVSSLFCVQLHATPEAGVECGGYLVEDKPRRFPLNIT
jgi:hypothetical protein